MSMWADYKREREGKCVIEVPHEGFIVFSYPSAQEVWIEDIYTVKEQRKTGLARRLADQVCALAKSEGCSTVLGSVWQSANGATDSIKVLLAYGMELSHTEGKLIIFKKEL